MPIKKILVVDDSATMRHILYGVLTKLGYEVVVAENGGEGVLKAQQEMPHLIVMDVVMPDMNGYQATRAITRDAATRHIPIIILTSRDQATDRIWGMRQGARAYLAKPFNADELQEKIAAIEASERAIA